MVKIFCINLDRATERRSFIQKEWIDRLGFDIQFWKAHDRRNVFLGDKPYPYYKDKAIQKFGRELNDGEIACATSHCQLLNHCLSSNIDEAIIMEDDIVPLIDNKEIFFEKINLFKQEFAKPMALLHNIHPFEMKKIHDKIFFERKTYFSLCNTAPCGTSLFYINKYGMEVLLNELKQMHCPADYPQRDIFSKNELVCVSNIPLGYHEWIGSTTYIGYDKRSQIMKLRTFIE